MTGPSARTPLPNRGVPDVISPSDVSVGMDWLRVSLPDMVQVQALLKKDRFLDYLVTEKPLSPFPHYDSALQLTHGRVDWHSERPEQRTLITLTGRDLRSYEAAGGDPRDLLTRFLFLRDARATRIDLAIDVRDHPCDRLAVAEAVRSGQAKTHISSVSVVQSTSGAEAAGETVYLGSRQSSRVIRIYDKALEAGVGGFWTRIELEAHDDHATSLMMQCAGEGIAPITGAAIRSMIVSGVDWFDTVVDYADVGIPLLSVGRKETRQEAWLWKTVVPAVVRGINAGVPNLVEHLQEAIAAYEARSGHSR